MDPRKRRRAAAIGGTKTADSGVLDSEELKRPRVDAKFEDDDYAPDFDPYVEEVGAYGFEDEDVVATSTAVRSRSDPRMARSASKTSNDSGSSQRRPSREVSGTASALAAAAADVGRGKGDEEDDSVVVELNVSGIGRFKVKLVGIGRSEGQLRGLSLPDDRSLRMKARANLARIQEWYPRGEGRLHMSISPVDDSDSYTKMLEMLVQKNRAAVFPGQDSSYEFQVLPPTGDLIAKKIVSAAHGNVLTCVYGKKRK